MGSAGLLCWLKVKAPDAGCVSGQEVEINIVIGGFMIFQNLHSSFHPQEAVGESFPKTSSPTCLSFSIVRPGWIPELVLFIREFEKPFFGSHFLREGGCHGRITCMASSDYSLAETDCAQSSWTRKRKRITLNCVNIMLIIPAGDSLETP